MVVRIINRDVMEGLAQLADESVHCVVTSPPYWGLRDYGAEGQIGLEPTPDAFVAKMVEVFREVRRVLRADGTLWLNLGDSYAAGGMGAGSGKQLTNRGTGVGGHMDKPRKAPDGLKPKDLVGIPWRAALALQADGWYLRSDVIWHKPNPMPESVTDRPTKSHEYVFLMSKSERYFYDAEAIKEPASYLGPNGAQQSPYAQGFGRRTKEEEAERRGRKVGNKSHKYVDQYEVEEGEQHRTKAGLMKVAETEWLSRNKRSVWTIATQPFKDSHFATMPPELPELCIKAGCPVGGTVLDPFSGAGTTALVADRLQRNAIGIELNPEYAAMSERRINGDRGALLDLMEASE